MKRTALARLGLATAFATLTTTLGALSALPRSPETWRIDKAHSHVTFTVTKWGFSEVEGRFFDFDGTIRVVADHPEQSRVEWHVRVASVGTGAPNRDKALQSEEYFDAGRFPEMTFVSDHVRLTAPNQLEVQGRMTIRGATHPITVNVLYQGSHPVPKEGTYEMFQSEFVINRHDYGIEGGSLLGPAISNEAKIKLIAAALH